MGDANTLAAMLQQLTLGLGVVFGALLLNVSSSLHSRSLGIPGEADFRIALFATAIVALFGLIDSVMLDADAGRAISGHRR